MADRQAVVWTRAGGAPVKMGDLYVTDQESRFTYQPDYIDLDLPGLGLLYPPRLFVDTTLRFPRTPWFDLPPPLQALIPPREPNNFQRRLILRYLHKRGLLPEPGFDEDWHILMTAGHGGIGHLDVFAEDAAAEHWYARSVAPPTRYAVDAGFGLSLKSFLGWYDEQAEAFIDTIGPTPTVGGAIPKLLVSIPETGWDGTLGLPTRGLAPGLMDVILKLERSPHYPGLVELEALALDIHRDAGFSVPRHWQVDIAGLPALLIERYDRSRTHLPLPAESLYSVLASGSRDVTDNHSVPYETIGRAIDNPYIDIVSDRSESKRHLLRRLILALLTGNGDLHLENLALITLGGITKFSPVYDPTPMRAYPIHNVLMPMPFGGYGDPDQPRTLREALFAFARELGIRKPACQAELDDCLAITAGFEDRLAALKTLPDDNRVQLTKSLAKVRSAL